MLQVRPPEGPGPPPHCTGCRAAGCCCCWACGCRSPLASSQVTRHLPAGPPPPPPSQGAAPRLTRPALSPWPVEEEDPAFWNRQAAQALDVAKKLQPIQTAAKNLILFLGDGEWARPVQPLGPPQPWHPRLPADPGQPGGLRPNTVCTFRDGGAHGDSHSDPKGADEWQAGT